MGTRGFRIVRFRGRYFVYYNHWDSYPKGLGAGIVAQIPTDTKKYEEWLQDRIHEYTRLTIELEQQVLTVPTQHMNDILRQDSIPVHPALAKRTEPLWKQLDEDLNELPTVFSNIFDDVFIEWTYLIDLDQELFTINNWISFKLCNIPRDTWISAFSFEEDDMYFSHEKCPEGFTTLPPLDDHFATVEEQNALSAEYKQFKIELVLASVGLKVSHRSSPQDLVGLLAFALLVLHNHHQLLPRCAHNGFALREFAFAIMSLAAGQFRFDNLRRYAAGQDYGFLIGKRADERPLLMPVFGSGCHAKGQEPGSAPAETSYWFDGVLVNLVPDMIFEEGFEVAVAKAVMSGRKQGHQSFQALLCSGLRVMFIEVQSKDEITHVRHTDSIPLFKTGIDTDRCSAWERIARRCRGFRMLQYFFHTAAKRRLSNFGPGVMPVEVYANIIEYVDRPTRTACQKVNQTFRTLCQDRFHFGLDFDLLGPEDKQALTSCDEDEGQRHHSRAELQHIGSFKFQNTLNGDVFSTSLSKFGWFGKREEWCPIIGSSDRPSIITAIEFNPNLK